MDENIEKHIEEALAYIGRRMALGDLPSDPPSVYLAALAGDIRHLQAQLEAQRPLVEAANELGETYNRLWGGRGGQVFQRSYPSLHACIVALNIAIARQDRAGGAIV